MSCVIDKKFRRNIDYSVYDLSRFCGVSAPSMYMILDSRASPRVYLALKICMYFSIHSKHGYFTPEDFWVFDEEDIKE